LKTPFACPDLKHLISTWLFTRQYSDDTELMQICAASVIAVGAILTPGSIARRAALSLIQGRLS
jgi:hypothetical protein